MKEFNVKQGSEEWIRLRLGIPTASRFSKILTPKLGKPSAQQADLIDELIAEKMALYLPERSESYSSNAMRYGQQTEAEARNWYALERGIDVREVGFCLSDCGRWGCSPDGLLDPSGGLELKCPYPSTHVRYLRVGGLPDDYKNQVHGCLIVTGREWWDFVSYAIGLPPFIVRVVPDEYTTKLRDALDKFHEDYMAALRKCEAGWRKER